jgi:hypothetical protein
MKRPGALSQMDKSCRFRRKAGAHVVVAREGLLAFMGNVTMMPLSGGGLAAEARLDGAALIWKCLGNQLNRCVAVLHPTISVGGRVREFGQARPLKNARANRRVTSKHRR